MKDAFLMGMTEEQFNSMTMRIFDIRWEAFREEQALKDYHAWNQGRYYLSAMAAALSDKHHPYRYPEKPFSQEYEDNRIIDGSNLTDEEKAAEVRKIMKADGYVFDDE